MTKRDEFLFVIREARARGVRLTDADLRRELAMLADQRQAQALALHYLQGCNQTKTAAALGVSRQAVMKLLDRGVTNLAARLADAAQTQVA